MGRCVLAALRLNHWKISGGKGDKLGDRIDRSQNIKAGQLDT
jgi:hypothetical protein